TSFVVLTFQFREASACLAERLSNRVKTTFGGGVGFCGLGGVANEAIATGLRVRNRLIGRANVFAGLIQFLTLLTGFACGFRIVRCIGGILLAKFRGFGDHRAALFASAGG